MALASPPVNQPVQPPKNDPCTSRGIGVCASPGAMDELATCDKLLLDFSGTGESADICCPLLSKLSVSDLDIVAATPPNNITHYPLSLHNNSSSSSNPSCTSISEFGVYQDEVSSFGPDHNFKTKGRGKYGRRNFRVGRLEGLSVAPIWCQQYKGRLLRQAVQKEDLDLMRELLGEGVHVDSCDDKQRTSLHLACVKGNIAIVDLLLNHGANPNCKDVNKNTPLMLACLSRHIAVITKLLLNGADPHLCDSKGHNALTLAQNRLTNLEQCQLACGYLTDELLHIVNLIKQFMATSTFQSHNNQPVSAATNSTANIIIAHDEEQLNAMIAKLSVDIRTRSSLSSSQNNSQNKITSKQVLDEFQELLNKFSNQVKLS